MGFCECEQKKPLFLFSNIHNFGVESQFGLEWSDLKCRYLEVGREVSIFCTWVRTGTALDRCWLLVIATHAQWKEKKIPLFFVDCSRKQDRLSYISLSTLFDPHHPAVIHLCFLLPQNEKDKHRDDNEMKGERKKERKKDWLVICLPSISFSSSGTLRKRE